MKKQISKSNLIHIFHNKLLQCMHYSIDMLF